MKKRGLDRELILGYGIMAFIAAVGLLFMFMFFMGIDATTCNKLGLLSIYCILTMIIWVFLLMINC